MTSILVVDDEEPLREILAFVFEKAGFAVSVANNGAHALKVLEQEVPDVILADLMMPVMDGRELCKQLKGDVRTAIIPFVIMSSAGVRAADGMGADGYIEKPFELRELEELVRSTLHNS